MAGKSTYLRQVGLIVIMAQMGSFIPAKSAKIGMVDKVFTRVGASDNLAAGESTFLMEMNETAVVLVRNGFFQGPVSMKENFLVGPVRVTDVDPRQSMDDDSFVNGMMG